MTTILKISEAFSKFPAGRHRADGPNTGERFRDDYLVPALKTNSHVTVNIDDLAGLPSSFLEEALGGLVRLGWSAHELRSKLEIEAKTLRMKNYVNQAWKYISDESTRAPIKLEG